MRTVNHILKSHKVSAVISLFLMSVPTFAQDLNIIRVEYKESKVLIHYDLKDSIEGRSFIIRAYSSLDNFVTPLTKVTGDVGFEVKGGLGKVLAWDPKLELGADFNGKVGIEVRAQIFIPFIRIDGFEDHKTIVRGRSYSITWSGGTPQNILNFHLYQGEKKIMSFPNIANVGHFKLMVPVHVRPGKGYRFQVVDSKNSDDIVNTGLFRVKRKIPLALKGVAVALLGAGAMFLIPEEPWTFGGPPTPHDR